MALEELNTPHTLADPPIKLFRVGRFVHLQCVLCAAALAICGAASADDAAAQPATIVVRGKVWTADETKPWAEAVAVRGSAIVAVGSRDEIAPLIDPHTEVIETGDGLVVPGLIDSHVHLVDGGLSLENLQLRDATTREEFVRRIKQRAEALPDGEWILGGDWDHTRWGGELPDRKWIDSVTPDNPVWIHRLDGHMALANSAAMAAAGVEDDVDDVEGGEIVRDRKRRPTGIFKDEAMALVDESVPEATLAERLAATLKAMDYLAARGVTAVHHMGSWAHLDVFRLAHRRGLMKTRIYACIPLAQWQRLARETKAWGRGDEWLQIGGLKGYVDGSLGSRTAAFFEPFADQPGARGLLVNTAEDLEDWTAAADREGLQVCVHAIGDRAIRLQLDVFERVAHRNGPRDRRFRIEHAQHIAPDDIPRFAKLGVIASMQPYHAIDDGRWAERVIGTNRSDTTYAFRSLLDNNSRIAFGSDWFVAPPTPLEGVYAAVTRRTLDGLHPEGWVPRQKISVAEALRAYTIDAAYAAFNEKSQGSLEPGKLADMVVVDRNLFEIPAKELNAAQVEITIVGGKVVYRRGQKADSPTEAVTPATTGDEHETEE